jgi:adenylyltransferase/sulfurtransferase
LNCEAGGVFNHVPGILGLMQSAEALKYLYGLSPSLVDNLLLVDILTMHFEKIAIEKRVDCQICGKNKTIKDLVDYESFCGFEELTIDIEDEIDPQGLKEQLHSRNNIMLIDVREKEEYALSRLPGATLVPFSDLPRHCDKIQKDTEIVVYCRTGIRSLRALRMLRENGFKKVLNLKGGITAWINDIDPSMIKY